MRTVIALLVALVVAVPALAGPPLNGTYKSIDLPGGGTVLTGRYAEYQPTTPVAKFNTLNEMSWDGSTLGGQWWWYCPWMTMVPTLIHDGVVGGNGNRIYRTMYAGGFCWFDGGGPWGNGDAEYTAEIDSWITLLTETWAGGVLVGSVRTINAGANFVGYTEGCALLSLQNTEMIGSTYLGGTLPADYPDFWEHAPCASVGTAGPGEWGTVEGITITIQDCETVPATPTSWGQIKQIYE